MGWMFGTQVGQEPGDLSIPAARWHAQGQPRPARVPVARPGARGSGLGSAGERGCRSERAAVPPRTALSDLGCVLAPGPPQSAGEGAGTPSPPLPSAAPGPTPLTRLGCLVPLRAPHCRLQLRLQLRFPLWLRSRSGSRLVAAALGLRLRRRGGRAAPPRPARRAGAWRGGALPSRPGARDPRPRRRRWRRLPGFPAPALPQPRPAARRPRAAAHATAASSRRPAPRLRGLSSTGPPPGSFLS